MLIIKKIIRISYKHSWPKRTLKISSLLFCIILFYQSIFIVHAFNRDIDEILEDVVPSNGVSIPIEWESFLEKLEAEGVVEFSLLDEQLFNIRGYGLTIEEQSYFQYSSNTIRIDSELQTFLLAIFAAFGFSNNNILLDEHVYMMENYSSSIGYAKYDSVEILKFSFEQQQLVEDIALNSYVPCCNNPVLVPNSNYGYANLGLIEFLVYNGITRDEIFKTLLIFNSYWFPDKYIDIAFFIEYQEQNWNQINSTQIMGYSYSSLEGYQTIKKFLVESNLYNPISEEYIQHPFLQYRQPILILFVIIFSGLTFILTWFLWKELTFNKKVVKTNSTK